MAILVQKTAASAVYVVALLYYCDAFLLKCTRKALPATMLKDPLSPLIATFSTFVKQNLSIQGGSLLNAYIYFFLRQQHDTFADQNKKDEICPLIYIVDNSFFANHL